ncbi:MAG: hypothetical protein AVDCRST_MAG69-2507, partial [uncultured Solirubrobacteraceae bacterium]
AVGFLPRRRRTDRPGDRARREQGQEPQRDQQARAVQRAAGGGIGATQDRAGDQHAAAEHPTDHHARGRLQAQAAVGHEGGHRQREGDQSRGNRARQRRQRPAEGGDPGSRPV